MPPTRLDRRIRRIRNGAKTIPSSSTPQRLIISNGSITIPSLSTTQRLIRNGSITIPSSSTTQRLIIIIKKKWFTWGVRKLEVVKLVFVKNMGLCISLAYSAFAFLTSN